MKIKIEVPGNKIHTLAPYVVTRYNKKKPLHNAPMTLAEVEGDMVVMVTVTGEMKPGSTMPKDKQGNTIPFTFQGVVLSTQDTPRQSRTDCWCPSRKTLPRSTSFCSKSGKMQRRPPPFTSCRSDGDVTPFLVVAKGHGGGCSSIAAEIDCSASRVRARFIRQG